MSKLIKNEDAFTGLEAAIVLIAFIVVAAVFSYVMLGAGFFATGEAQRVVDTGVAQASSAVELSGPVIVRANTTAGGDVANVTFFLQLAAGGAPVDMQKVTFTVATDKEMKTYTYKSSVRAANETYVGYTWYAHGGEQEEGKGNNDMLEKFETVEITVATTHLTNKIGPNDWFTVEVKPDVGAALPIKRIAPPDLNKNQCYEVF